MYFNNFTNEESANHSILLKESDFSLSTIAMLHTLSCENGTEPSADHNIRFEIENCSLLNSFFTAQIESESTININISFKNTIVNSENGTGINLSNEYNVTGLHIDISPNVTLYLEMKKCELTGNDVGLAVAANGYIDADIEQCKFVGNGGDFPLIFSQKFGGIGFLFGENAMANINISFTLISENKFVQVYIDDIVTMGNFMNFECTMDNKNVDITFELTHSSITYAKPLIEDSFSIGLQVNILSAYIYVQDCEFENSPVEIGMSETTLVDSSFIQKGLFIWHPNATINIDNCTFAQNKDIAIAMANSRQIVHVSQTKILENMNGIILFEQNEDSKLILKSCMFHENTGVSLGVLDLVFNNNPPKNPTKIDAINVTFANNENNSPQAGIVQVDASINLLIGDQCIFENNKGSAVRAFTTNVSLQGVVTFQNNLAYQGAAISLTSSMLILLEADNNQDTMILFTNNTAKNFGGSIFINQPSSRDTKSESPCFYMISSNTINKTTNFLTIITLEFRNNTARNGGFDIYGATVDSNCVVNPDNSKKIYYSINIQHLLFKFNYNTTEEILSSTTSSPKRICLCTDSRVQCANLTSIIYNIEHFPGETFYLPLIVAGLSFGTVSGTVYANLLPTTNNTKSSLGNNQDVRTYRELQKCKSIPFKILSNQLFETIVLTVNDSLVDQQGQAAAINSSINDFDKNSVVPVALSTVPVYVNVTLLDCPAGFQQTSNLTCDCDTILKEIAVAECSISEKKTYVTRSKNIWIKALPNSEKAVIGTMNCPFNYCNKKTMKIYLNESDLQCSLSHSGILCGGCPSNYSLAIGSSRCLECSDNYGILLVIAFAVMGIIFVMFIKILNLTVTAGLINGLLFYANVVWANQSLLFPPRQDTSTLLMILKIFLAWLNLDFGIEFCFIQHLDGYWKTWLQLVFPIYIWSIAGLIIVASNYSSKITKILGEWEAVLATLFLIAYTKLLRTILVAVLFTVLLGSNTNNMLVWSFDGNIEYFSAKHSILFVVGVAILLLLWLPYTFVLLFVQTFRKYSDRKFLRWVNRLKPMFDAYLGPLKNEHQYWVGLRLFARLILVVSSAILLSIAPFITAVLIIIVSSILCLFASTVYNRWLPTILDGCSLINLVIFSTGTLFIEADNGNKDELACISVGIAFIIFLCIIVCQIWTKLKGLKAKKRDTNNIADYEDLDGQNTELYRSATFQEISVPKLRESLLEVETQN